jgi:RNA polymerase sigma-70 factor (ECF subfamily)
MNKQKQEEFLRLYEPVHERFERFCRARVYGTMDFRDLMNETLLVAFGKFEGLRSKDAFLSFLFGVSVRILRNHHQKIREGKIMPNHERQMADQGNDPQQLADVHFLHEALAKLPDEQKEAIILFELSGFNIREIAEIQEASETAVKQRLKRGRDKLKEILTFQASPLKGEINHG